MKKAIKTAKVILPAVILLYVVYLLLKPAISETEAKIAAYSPLIEKKK